MSRINSVRQLCGEASRARVLFILSAFSSACLHRFLIVKSNVLMSTARTDLKSKFTSCRSMAVSVALLLSACIASLNAASSSRAAMAKAAKPRGLPAVAPGYYGGGNMKTEEKKTRDGDCGKEMILLKNTQSEHKLVRSYVEFCTPTKLM